MNVHDRVALPEPVTLVGEMHDELFVLKVTSELNPLNPDTTIVELPFPPTFTDTLVGLPVIEKSGFRLT